MVLSLLNDKEVKQTIIHNLQEEKYTNYYMDANNKNILLNHHSSISNFLLEHSQEDFYLSFCLYPLEDSQFHIEENYNLFIDTYQNIIKKASDFTNGLDNKNIQHILQQKNTILHFFQLALKKQVEDCNYYVIPILTNKEKINQSYLFNDSTTNLNFISDFFNTHIINYINQIKKFNNYYQDINFLIFCYLPNTKNKTIELKQIQEEHGFKHNYLSREAATFFQLYLSSIMLKIYSCLTFERDNNNVNFVFNQKDLEEFKDYKVYYSDRFMDLSFDFNKEKQIMFNSHHNIYIYLNKIKQNIIRTLTDIKNQDDIVNIIMLYKIFPNLSIRLFMDHWKYFYQLSNNKMHYNFIQHINNKYLNTKKFSKQLAQADIQSNYIFTSTNDKLKEDQIAFQKYDKKELTFNLIKYSIQTLLQNSQANSAEEFCANSFNKENKIIFYRLYYAMINKGYNYSTTFFTYDSQTETSFLCIIASPINTQKIIKLAKKMIINDFSYSVDKINNNSDIIIFSSNVETLVLPYSTIYYNYKWNKGITIKIPFTKKPIVIKDKENNSIKNVDWLQTSPYIGLELSSYTLDRYNDDIPLGLIANIKNQPLDINTKRKFINSETFKQDLLSL